MRQEYIKLLVGPIHPEDPLQAEWGFVVHGLSTHVRQHGPEDPTHPIQFHSHSFKDAEKQNSVKEKGCVVKSTLQEAGKL